MVFCLTSKDSTHVLFDKTARMAAHSKKKKDLTFRSDLLKTVTAFYSSVDFLFFDFPSVMVFIFNKAPV